MLMIMKLSMFKKMFCIGKSTGKKRRYSWMTKSSNKFASIRIRKMVSIPARAIRLWLKVDLRPGLMKIMMERKLPTRPSMQINGMAMTLITLLMEFRRGSSW